MYVSRIIQVNDIDIGKNIARICKSGEYKQTDMVEDSQINGIDISVYLRNRIEKGTQKSYRIFFICLLSYSECDMNAIFDFKAIM